MLNKTMVANAIRFALEQDNWKQDYWHGLEPECGTTHCVAGFEDIRISTENGTLHLLQEFMGKYQFENPLRSCLYNDVQSAWGATREQWDWITRSSNDRATLLSIVEVLEDRADEDIHGVDITGYSKVQEED